MNDDEFDDLMRRSDPARHVRDTRTDQQINAAVALVTREQQLPSTTRRWPWIALPAAAVLVALTLLVINLWQPNVAASAATPIPLRISPAQERLGEVMSQAIALTHAEPQGASERRASYEGWYLQTDVEAGESRSVIAPQEHSLKWNEDFSGELIVTAGTPYIVRRDVTAPAPETVSVPAGTVLLHDSYAAGQMPVMFTTPPEHAASLREYLAVGIGVTPSTAAEYLNAIRILQSEWTPSASVRGAMLELLRSDESLELAGEVVDRLGRAGYALRVTSPTSPQFEYIAVVSRLDGSIIAVETIYAGGLDELDVPVGSVVDYIAWK